MECVCVCVWTTVIFRCWNRRSKSILPTTEFYVLKTWEKWDFLLCGKTEDDNNARRKRLAINKSMFKVALNGKFHYDGRDWISSRAWKLHFSAIIAAVQQEK